MTRASLLFFAFLVSRLVLHIALDSNIIVRTTLQFSFEAYRTPFLASVRLALTHTLFPSRALEDRGVTKPSASLLLI